VYISTTGCVEAQLSSKAVARILELNNYTLTKEVGEADFVIFYACGLTDYSEEKSLLALKNLKKGMNKDAKLITWGCLSKQNPEAFKSIQGQDQGPSNLLLRQSLETSDIPLNESSFAASTEELVHLREASPQTSGDSLDRLTRSVLLARQGKNKLRDNLSGRTRAYYIRIAIGCNGNCTYCSEKPVFGDISSRSIEDVVSDLKQGLKLGYNRFSLLATDLGAYGMDINSNLGELLNRMIEVKTDIAYKLILNQIEPQNLTMIYPALDEALASGRVEELMCPVQSGSNRILKLMGRRYTIEDWRSNMLKIYTNHPKIRLNTHLMVGFPTESDEDFRETKELLNPPPFFDDITVFKYSSRPSVASRLILGQIPEEIKEDRRRELLRKYAGTYLKNIKL
jgi:MiaB/RimO family radical SAM methylthiotransferase